MHTVTQTHTLQSHALSHTATYIHTQSHTLTHTYVHTVTHIYTRSHIHTNCCLNYPFRDHETPVCAVPKSKPVYNNIVSFRQRYCDYATD